MAEQQNQTNPTPPESLVRLFDESDGQYKQVPASQAAATLQDPNSKMGFKTGDSYYFQYPDGGLGKASDVNEFYAALQAGGKEIDERTARLRKEAKGTLGTLTAFGTGAASSATFGLSDLAARGLDELTDGKLGITERIKASQEANPFATGAGQVAGAIGSAVLVPGGGLVGAASRLATSAVNKAAGGALTSLAAKGTLGSIASAGARLGATGAIEGGLQGVGQTISQQALQSTPMGPVESLVANVGTGILFGGVAGGTLGAGGKALAPVVGGVGKGFTTVMGKLKGASGEENAASRAIFEPGSEALKAIKNPGKFEDEVATSTAKLMNDIEKSGINASTQMDDLIARTASDPTKGTQAKQVISDYITAITKDPDIAPSIKSEFVKIQNKLTPLAPAQKQAIETELGELTQRLASPVSAAEKVSLESQVASLQKQLSRDAPENALASIRQAKRELFDVKRGWSTAQRQTGNLDAAAGLQQVEGLEKVLKTTVWDEATFGPQAGLLADLDEAIATRYAAFDKLKESGAVKKVGQGYELKRQGVRALLRDERNAELVENLLAAEHKVQAVGAELGGQAVEKTASELPGMIKARQTVRQLFDSEMTTGKALGPGALGYMFGGPAGALLVHTLENPGQMTKFLANRYSNALTVGGLTDKAADGGWGVLQGIASSLNQRAASEAQSQRMQMDAQMSIKKTSEAIDKAASGLMYKDPKAALNPSQSSRPMSVKEFKDTVASLNTPQGFDDLPLPAETKASLVVSRDLAKNFLESKLPPPRTDDLGLPQPPTQPQLAKWSRYYAAVNDPLSVFKDMGEGYVSPEGLEALKTVYPALYAAMQEQVRGTLQQDPKPKNKLLVATVLGGQMSPTTRANALAARETWALAQQEAGAAGGGSGVKFPASQPFEPMKRGGMV
jgi:hypothetical protein